MLIAATIAALLVIFMPRSSALYAQLDQVEDRIKKDVKNDEQRKQALAIVSKMESDAKEGVEERKKTVEALTKLLQDRQSSIAEIEAAARPLESQDIAGAEKYLDLRFELTKVLTESEWALVFPKPGAAPAPDSAEKKGDASTAY